ncbi:hypothetical protein AYO38_02850 [bacterium SCGC AG-212-C10]|nr:hypothetical protein AYO38_02850 [bacterium SCGC AG-212-C10]
MQNLTLTTNRTAIATSAANRTSTNPGRKTSIALWTVQGALAAIFLFAGASKLIMPADVLAEQSELPVLFLRFIGLSETLGAVGLILPSLLRIRTGLTPLAAAGLVVIMIGATSLVATNTGTVTDTNPAMAAFPLVVGLLAAVIVYGRTRLAPQTNR